MNRFDRVLQRWRIRKAVPHVPPGSRVLDIGCFDGALLQALDGHIALGVGIDPCAPEGAADGAMQLIRGTFPQDMPDLGPFDVITALAVVEHLALEEGPPFVQACERLLVPGGLLVITVPNPVVDPILHAMVRLRILDGMSLEEHHGFNPQTAQSLFAERGFELLRRGTFQLGLNNVFVFRRPGEGR